MTFLIDPPLLIIFGFLCYIIGEKLRERTRLPITLALAIFTMATIWFMSISLYLNMPHMDWFWQAFPPATSGKELMINSNLFAFESVNTAGLVDAIAFLIIATYPIWLYIGLKVKPFLDARHTE